MTFRGTEWPFFGLKKNLETLQKIPTIEKIKYGISRELGVFRSSKGDERFFHDWHKIFTY